MGMLDTTGEDERDEGSEKRTRRESATPSPGDDATAVRANQVIGMFSHSSPSLGISKM